MSDGAGCVAGWAAPGFEPVRDAFEASFDRGRELGAAFAACADGELIVDLWGGVADAPRDTGWREDTLCPIFSGTKGLVATCVLQLVDRGLLDLELPLAEYWPEFAARGKETVRVRHVVSHQGGLPGFRQPIPREDVPDHARMASRLTEESLFWPPGSRLWYHPFTFGWLCGELVRRITGETVGTHLRREVAEPLGLELWLGLPDELESRVARCRLADDWRGPDPDAPPGEITAADLRAIWHNPYLFGEDMPWNSPAWHSCEIPGANGIATARGLALHYGALAADVAPGKTALLSPEAVAFGCSEIAAGVDPCHGGELRMGVGWALQNETHDFGPPARAFGHGGAGGSMHGAWPRERVGFSYVTNLMRGDAEDRRASDLLAALHSCLH